jgi:hypothetical protein
MSGTIIIHRGHIFEKAGMRDSRGACLSAIADDAVHLYFRQDGMLAADRPRQEDIADR